ncbi:MAG: hypothetical protein MJB14_09540, partial [Spirochaetes bacterium]|nr:hypothetical protein [Spirochaetota bacterium]
MEKLTDFEKNYPNYHHDQLTIPLLKMICYTAINDLEKSSNYFNKVTDNLDQTPVSQVLGINILDIYVGRLYLKYLNYQEAYEANNRLFEMLSGITDEYIKSFNFQGILRIYYVDDLALNIILYSKKKSPDKRYQDRLDILFSYLIDLHKSTGNEYETILITFAELIDFQTVEGEYHTDMIWSDEVFIKYFKKLKKEKLINKKTLSDL